MCSHFVDYAKFLSAIKGTSQTGNLYIFKNHSGEKSPAVSYIHEMFNFKGIKKDSLLGTAVILYRSNNNVKYIIKDPDSQYICDKNNVSSRIYMYM